MMGTSPVDKRNFYLALSIMEGQKIASSAGFSVPSAEVQESEIMDTISRWLILTNMGIFQTIQECSDWMMDVVKVHNDLDDDDLENTKNVIMSFGMALLSHLIDNEMILLPEAPPRDIDSSKGSAIFNLLTFIITDDEDEELFDLELEDEEEDDE
jgi:hypothetical protein